MLDSYFYFRSAKYYARIGHRVCALDMLKRAIAARDAGR